jgi:hypothetical protein
VIRREADPLPIHVIGDSHVLSYRHVALTEEVTGQSFVTRSRYLPSGFCAENFFTQPAGFHKDFYETLVYEGLVRNGYAVHHSADRMDLTVAQATGMPTEAPLLLVSCGDITVRSSFLPHFKDEHDFILPGEHPYGVTNKPIVPSDLCQRLMEQRASQIIQALAKLRGLGFTRTYLHCIVPPTTNDTLFQQINGFRCPVNTRYKAARMFNAYLAEKCRAMGGSFIDIWPDVTENGYLKPEYELDGVHLTRPSILFSLRHLLRDALSAGGSVNHRRYDILYSLACGKPPAQLGPGSQFPGAPAVAPVGLETSPTWQTQPAPAVTADAAMREAAATFRRAGICLINIPKSLLARWSNRLSFDQDVSNRNPSFQWAGNTIQPFSRTIRYAPPPEELMEDIRALFGNAAFESFFRLAHGCPIQILNCRPFQSLPHTEEGAGPQSFHRDGCPPGVIRGIVYLTDVGPESGPFEYKDAATGAVQAVTAPAGTLLVFDANRLEHRARPPRKSARQALDLVFSPRLPNQEMRVVCAGMNNWPNDPMQISLRGMRCVPPVRDETLSAHFSV